MLKEMVTEDGGVRRRREDASSAPGIGEKQENLVHSWRVWPQQGAQEIHYSCGMEGDIWGPCPRI